MEKLDLDSIKHANIINIFDLIVKYDIKISRADIAKRTNLSIMTVGKVVDDLIANKILIQSKEIKGSVGRKAGLVMLNPNRMGFVIDLTSYNFCLTVVDFCLKPRDKIVYKYNMDYSYQENFIIFIKNVKNYFNKKFNDDSCYYGLGIILPGKYAHIPELETIEIKSVIKDIIGYEINCFESDIDASARSILFTNYNTTVTETENIIIHIYINDQNYIHSSVIFNGTVIHGSTHNAGDIGEIDGICMQELCELLNNMIAFLNPNLIIIECDILKSNNIKNDICNCLLNDYKLKEYLMPEFVIYDDDIRHSNRGIAIKLRKLWFENLL